MGVAGSSEHPVLSSAAGEVVKCEWITACKTKINSWNNNNSLRQLGARPKGPAAD
jgi:hypothetical protein